MYNGFFKFSLALDTCKVISPNLMGSKLGQGPPLVICFAFSSEDLSSLSPELVQMGQSIIDLLGCTGRKGDGVPDQI